MSFFSCCRKSGATDDERASLLGNASKHTKDSPVAPGVFDSVPPSNPQKNFENLREFLSSCPFTLYMQGPGSNNAIISIVTQPLEPLEDSTTSSNLCFRTKKVTPDPEDSWATCQLTLSIGSGTRPLENINGIFADCVLTFPVDQEGENPVVSRMSSIALKFFGKDVMQERDQIPRSRLIFEVNKNPNLLWTFITPGAKDPKSPILLKPEEEIPSRTRREALPRDNLLTVDLRPASITVVDLKPVSPAVDQPASKKTSTSKFLNRQKRGRAESAPVLPDSSTLSFSRQPSAELAAWLHDSFGSIDNLSQARVRQPSSSEYDDLDAALKKHPNSPQKGKSNGRNGWLRSLSDPPLPDNAIFSPTKPLREIQQAKLKCGDNEGCRGDLETHDQ